MIHKSVASIILFVGLVSTNPCLAAGNADAPKTSFDYTKQYYYQHGANQTGIEHYGRNFEIQPGSDRPATYAGPIQSGTVPSGLAPSMTTAMPTTQALQADLGAVSPKFVQVGMTLYEDRAKLGYHPHGTAYMYIQPHNPQPVGMNPQSFKNAPYLTGATFASDLVQHALTMAASQRTAEKILDPNLQSITAAYQGAVQQTADATAGQAAGAFNANMNTTSSSLINIANENAARQPRKDQKTRTISEAVWIVQQMYKAFFLPLGLLLLVVGAVTTQTMNYVRASFIATANTRPLEGILRAIVAIFLIGAIQLTVSYAIDFGNVMTATVKQAVDLKSIEEWSQDITNPTRNMTHAQREAHNQNESTASATTRVVFGTAQALLNTALMVLTVYQLIMVCYLYLLGPIAAAMFAWPDGVGTLFRPIFSNWLNGLSDLVLWRFWWCVILLCMATRIQWLKDIGSYNPGSSWEPIVYTAFMVMLTYVPFAALDFKPGDMVDSLLEKAAAKQG